MARSTVAFGVLMPVVLLLLTGAIVLAVFAAAWIADRLLRTRHGEGNENDTDRSDTTDGPLSSQTAYGGLDAFTWTEEEPGERR